MSIDPNHLALIYRIVHGFTRRLPRIVDPGDLISDGFLGLRQALERYDPSRGVPFEHFAARRIQGAILDGLRARDRFPKGFRSGKQFVPKFVKLNAEMLFHSEAHRFEMREAIQQAMRTLPRRARLLLQLYYFEQLTMHQIGECMGITESAISQLHASTLRKLARSGGFDYR